MEVAVHADHTDDAAREQRGILVTDEAGLDALSNEDCDVVHMDVRALAQRVSEAMVDGLDLEQREERRVDGHEADGCLCALADARERIGVRIECFAL